MTIHLLRGRGTARAATPPADGVMITEDQPEVLSCPACGRPLEAMNGRCPGCGTRLVLGVQARRAAVFTGFGILSGALIGALATGILLGATRPLPVTDSAGHATAETPATGGGTAPETPVVPSAATSALSQAAVINGRLAGALERLQFELVASPLDAFGTAQALRALAADAAIGAQIAPQLAKWQDAAGLSADLAAFYASIRATAREGLAASLSNVAAYEDAGTRMVAVFTALSGLDDATQQLANAAGISVPSVTLPGRPDAPAASTAP